MSEDLKSGSVILSKEDAKYFENLKEAFSGMPSYLIKRNVYNSSRFHYYFSALHFKPSYEPTEADLLVKEITESNEKLSEQISTLQNRSLWQRIINN